MDWRATQAGMGASNIPVYLFFGGILMNVAGVLEVAVPALAHKLVANVWTVDLGQHLHLCRLQHFRLLLALLWRCAPAILWRVLTLLA